MAALRRRFSVAVGFGETTFRAVAWQWSANCKPPLVAHLPVRLRDGAGLVGPLKIPGVTSCLRNHQLEVGKQPTA